VPIAKRFYRQYGDYAVFVVDGEAVRDRRPEGDEEFGEWSIHAYFPGLIPEKEIWLEDDLPETEYPFVLVNAFTQLRRLSEGAALDAAYDAGNAAEKRMRQHRDASLLKTGDIYVRPYVRVGPITVWLVNGEVVRDRYYVPFIEGGNSGRYSFIPRNEVWLEYLLHADELPFILIHECVERHLMLMYGWKYDRAHHVASEVEYAQRSRGPLTVDDAVAVVLRTIHVFESGKGWSV
jgi:hypothetical protein